MPDLKFKDKVEFEDAEALSETPLALLVDAVWDKPGLGSIWFPKSQIDDDSEVWKKGQTGKFICSRWIAEQKGVI